MDNKAIPGYCEKCGGAMFIVADGQQCEDCGNTTAKKGK